MLIDGASQGFVPYVKQTMYKPSAAQLKKAENHAYGIASLKDRVSESNKNRAIQVRVELVKQLDLFASGRWTKMLSATEPPLDKTTAAPRGHLALQALVVSLLLCAIGTIAWLYRGELGGNVAAAALVIAMLALVFLFVPRFADAFSAATAAFKGVKEVAPPSKGPEDEPGAESADKP